MKNDSSSLQIFSLDLSLLITRIGVGLLMLTHGIPKLAKFFADEPIKFKSVLGMSSELSLGLAVFAEVFCSILIIIGFKTRMATIPLIITMLVAVFVVHFNDPFAKMEKALLFLLLYLVLLFSGGGKYAMDGWLINKSK
jgi:putative oxidoreductase